MDGDAQRPFFLMAWTQQTHHPYEPTPGVPMLPLSRDPVVDDYGFNRYLNVLHETDRQMSRVFEAVRRAGRQDDTLILVTGDHGQAFGYPHESFMQGRTIYDEDVRVPLLLWFPRKYSAPARATTVGSHVDLAPTIAELAGLPPAPDWQGRSLFDSERGPRAYFYVAEDEFMLGVREERWKYILNVRDGTEELFDLDLHSRFPKVSSTAPVGSSLATNGTVWPAEFVCARRSWPSPRSGGSRRGGRRSRSPRPQRACPPRSRAARSPRSRSSGPASRPG